MTAQNQTNPHSHQEKREIQSKPDEDETSGENRTAEKRQGKLCPVTARTVLMIVMIMAFMTLYLPMLFNLLIPNSMMARDYELMLHYVFPPIYVLVIFGIFLAFVRRSVMDEFLAISRIFSAKKTNNSGTSLIFTAQTQGAEGGQVVLKLDHIGNEIMWPEFDGDEMRVGWVDAFVGTKALLLNVKRIRRIYAFGGKLYVVYDAEVASRYERFAAPLPELAVELKFEIYEDRIYDGDRHCRIYRLAIDASDELKQFVSKLLRVEVGPDEYLVPPQSRPLNFTPTPIDVMLFGHHIKGIAVAENPAFDFLGDRDDTP
jgi:hypothetical protein